MILKLSKTALRELTRLYHYVLMGVIISGLISATAYATVPVDNGNGTQSTVYTSGEVDNLLSAKQDTLGDGSVETDNLADSAVTTNKIANSAVTAGKIADGAVTAGKIQEGAVGQYHIATGAVGTAEIANESITKTKLDSSLQTSIDQVATNKTAIDQNTQNITANTEKISNNTEAIAALQTGKANVTEVYAQITETKADASAKANAAEANAKYYTDALANGTVKNNTDAIAVLNGDVNKDGSVANIASGYANAAETNARSYTDTLIGTTDGWVEQNGVMKVNTVNQNIAALNSTIGDITDLNQYAEGTSIGNALTQGGTQSANTVVAALNNIDATLGTIHGLRDKLAASGAGTNLASGTTVEQHLTALDSAIGNRAYTSTRYITSGSDLSSAVSALDSNLSRIEGNLDALTNRTHKMHHEMKSGFASLAAMSALVPNARVAGDTQISVGAGHYRGTTGFALGAFHHVNDNVLLNAGAAYGGNGSATFKGGLTFGW